MAAHFDEEDYKMKCIMINTRGSISRTVWTTSLIHTAQSLTLFYITQVLLPPPQESHDTVCIQYKQQLSPDHINLLNDKFLWIHVSFTQMFLIPGPYTPCPAYLRFFIALTHLIQMNGSLSCLMKSRPYLKHAGQGQHTAYSWAWTHWVTCEVTNQLASQVMLSKTLWEIVYSICTIQRYLQFMY